MTVEPASGSLADAMIPTTAGPREFGNLVGGEVGVGWIVEGDRRADGTGGKVLDVQQRSAAGHALERFRRAGAGSGYEEDHVVERRPALAVDDFLNDGRESVVR